MNTSIKSLSLPQFQDIIKEAHLPTYRGNQILSWIYGKGISSYDEMTNVPKTVREQFSNYYPLNPLELVERLESADGSRKYLIRCFDDAVIESVGLPSPNGRLSVCVSSQSGCSMGCIFCATGKSGLTRSLQPGELVDQVLLIQKDFGKRVTNVVVMGQGEPFSNYESVLSGLRILNHPKLLAIGARHITISTCGILSGISKLSREPEQFTLAVSLHAARQDIRDTLIPSMKSQPLDKLKSSLEAYTEATGRRFSFEYALMKGLNDSQADLEALIEYSRGMLCHVNLIPLNNIDDSPIKPVSKHIMSFWSDELEKAGIACSIRKSRGSDIAAACGQLAARHRERDFKKF